MKKKITSLCAICRDENFWQCNACNIIKCGDCITWEELTTGFCTNCGLKTRTLSHDSFKERRNMSLTSPSKTTVISKKERLLSQERANDIISGLQRFENGGVIRKKLAKYLKKTRSPKDTLRIMEEIFSSIKKLIDII